MKTVILSGASDDLIEIEGDISEEFYADENENNYIAFSDGTLAIIEYTTSGFWRIGIICQGSADTTMASGTDLDKDYSDKLVLYGDISWVVHGKNHKVFQA